MTTVSDFYNLNRSQGDLDFVDVDIYGDVPVFLDPRALRLLPTQWADHCVSLLQDFFTVVLGHIQAGRDQAARSLLAALREPNETHLGLSKGRSQGRALGRTSASHVWEALAKSSAARSGLLVDLEDTVLLVEGISSDIVSDMATNIVRGPLIEYTQDVCRQFGIPLVPGVASGPLWNPQTGRWDQALVELPKPPSGRLLLIPKVIVRYKLDYDVGEYYRHFLLEHLKMVELRANSELVELLRDGRRRVTKKKLIEKYGNSKAAVVRLTQRYPQILEDYRRAKDRGVSPPLEHDTIADLTRTQEPQWDSLLNDVVTKNPGRSDASAYHAAVERLLSASFYPNWTNPRKEEPLHDGRKRIDITYTNMASSGFFSWLSNHHPSGSIMVECKNYSGDPANPELDQLSGRFSPNRGKVGFLVCRAVQNRSLFEQRCKDTASDGRGFILVLDDDDLRLIVQSRKDGNAKVVDQMLHERFDRLVGLGR